MRQVTAAVLVEGGRILLACRPPGDRLAGLWELPGGKVEPGETPQACLLRELREELAMACEVGGLVARTVYRYEHGRFELLAYEVDRRSDFKPLVHETVQWFEREELASLPLAPADVELLRQIARRGLFE